MQSVAFVAPMLPGKTETEMSGALSKVIQSVQGHPSVGISSSGVDHRLDTEELAFWEGSE